MLPTHLQTNEVRDAAKAEVEFLRRSNGSNGSKVEFLQNGETPNLPHRLAVMHSESGSGVNLRRRSAIRVDYSFVGSDGSVSRASGCMWLDLPVGNMANLDPAKKVAAELGSFAVGNGTVDVLTYDGSGNGISCLINGTL